LLKKNKVNKLKIAKKNEHEKIFISQNIDAHRGRGRGGAPHVPPKKIFENFHIKMQ
jgi:hypothetical protein